MTYPNDSVGRRLYACGKWKLESPAHFGGEDGGVADMSLLRDMEGCPFIPAGSVAGAARSHLVRRTLRWEDYRTKPEPAGITRFFGGAGDDDTMSTLFVADATCLNNGALTLVRDGVRVEGQTGSAADGAKFDVEVVERGTEFNLGLECIIRCGDDEAELTDLFLAVLYGFQEGDIRLGARTRRGYGKGKVEEWNIRDLRMKCPADVLAWLGDDVWNRSPANLEPKPLASDQRRVFRIEADFRLCTSLLVRSSTTDPQGPDMVHLESAGAPVVPGTSFAGAFRHRAALIASTIGCKKPDGAEDPLTDMFGPIHAQRPSANHGGKGLWASRVWIDERLVENVESKWQHRVAIDRFTGGSLESALFNEAPLFPRESTPHVRLNLTLEEPDRSEIGLLLLTLRDFWHGHAVVGGETGNGRGTLKGIRGLAQLIEPGSSQDWKLAMDDKGMLSVVKGNGEFLEDCVKRAQCPPDRPAGSRRPIEEKETGDA